MSPITYRDAAPADIPAIDALFRASFTDTFDHLYAPRDLAAFLGKFTFEAWAEELDMMHFRLAEQNGTLIGYAKIGPLALPVQTEEPALELWQLYVANEAKGAGVAQALMDWTIAAALDGGAVELYLSVYVDNHRARRFYARYGFVDIGRYDFMVGDHVDEDRLMKLVL